jgi:hypothetical protein
MGHTARHFLRNDRLSKTNFIGDQKPSATWQVGEGRERCIDGGFLERFRRAH